MTNTNETKRNEAMTMKERLLKADRKLTAAEWDHILWGMPIKRIPKKDPHARTHTRRFNWGE